MKKLLFTIVLLSSLFSVAQKNYILLKDGSKMEIDERDFYYSTFEKVRYSLPSKEGFEAIKGIDIDKVDKLVSGDITYIPFKYSEKKKKYMVLSKIIAETSDKMLLLSFKILVQIKCMLLKILLLLNWLSLKTLRWNHT